MTIVTEQQLDELDFDRGNGLIPVVAQHALTGEVLMLAYANREALVLTIEQNVMHFFSRSRGELWKKGETSGNIMRVVSLHGDCDGDAILARVLPAGPACHTGASNCFDTAPTLAALDTVIAERAAAHDGAGYTRKLLGDTNLRLKKLGEEAVELALACQREDRAAAAEEAADLLYHSLVACRAAGVSVADILSVLELRRSA